jgi:hypothetical protein
VKKANITIFVTVGMILIILVAIFLTDIKKKDQILNDNSLSNFQEYFDNCALDSIIKSNVIYGFIENKKQYETSITSFTDSCMLPYISELGKKGYTIKKEKATVASLDVNENTLVVKILYPVEVTGENTRFTFSKYTKTFERIKNINLKDVKDKLVLSSDGVLKLEFKDNGNLVNMYGDEKEEFMIIRLEDKSERKGGLLNGNLIYGLLPIQYISSSQIKLCFYLDKLLPDKNIPYSELKIVFWNPNSGKWGVVPTKYENGCLSGEINYTTFYGVMKTFTPFSTPSASFGPWDTLPVSAINAPSPNFNIYTSGASNQIFEQIRAEMGGPWPLIDNQDCVGQVVYSGAYCAAASTNCGNGIHCKTNAFSLNPTSQNLLFRHEITHSIQIMNDLSMTTCHFESPRKEWGAEYYSDTQCYKFIANGETYTARQLAEEMKSKNPACTDDLLMDAAFCKPGSYDKLKDLDCLLGSNGDIADAGPGIDCVNV